jgi:hypothetical protein
MRNDTDLTTREGKIEFHQSVVSKCSYAKKYKGDHERTQKDNYHYWKSKRALIKLEKEEKLFKEKL